MIQIKKSDKSKNKALENTSVFSSVGDPFNTTVTEKPRNIGDALAKARAKLHEKKQETCSVC